MRSRSTVSHRTAQCVFTLALALIIGTAQGAERGPLKIATIAPKGSIYHRVLQEIGEAYRSAAGAQARYIVYTDSIQGTEADTVRRMRVGQLDGSMLTVVGLTQIDPAVAALQYMPMMFRSWDELDYVREKLRPELEARLAAKGFVVLIWGDGGWVQFFSKERMVHPEDFKRARIFSWSGDIVQANVMKSQGYHPVSLPLTDILPALETGMIDVVPVAPLWALIGQFDRITSHMVRVNWVPIVGATVLRKQSWDALDPPARQAMTLAARRATEALRSHRQVQDEESIRAMQKRGLKIETLTPETEAAWQALAERTWPLVRGSMVPTETFDRVQSLLAEYRKSRP